MGQEGSAMGQEGSKEGERFPQQGESGGGGAFGGGHPHLSPGGASHPGDGPYPGGATGATRPTALTLPPEGHVSPFFGGDDSPLSRGSYVGTPGSGTPALERRPKMMAGDTVNLVKSPRMGTSPLITRSPRITGGHGGVPKMGSLPRGTAPPTRASVADGSSRVSRDGSSTPDTPGTPTPAGHVRIISPGGGATGRHGDRSPDPSVRYLSRSPRPTTASPTPPGTPRRHRQHEGQPGTPGSGRNTRRNPGQSLDPIDRINKQSDIKPTGAPQLTPGGGLADLEEPTSNANQQVLQLQPPPPSRRRHHPGGGGSGDLQSEGVRVRKPADSLEEPGGAPDAHHLTPKPSEPSSTPSGGGAPLSLPPPPVEGARAPLSDPGVGDGAPGGGAEGSHGSSVQPQPRQPASPSSSTPPPSGPTPSQSARALEEKKQNALEQQHQTPPRAAPTPLSSTVYPIGSGDKETTSSSTPAAVPGEGGETSAQTGTTVRTPKVDRRGEGPIDRTPDIEHIEGDVSLDLSVNGAGRGAGKQQADHQVMSHLTIMKAPPVPPPPPHCWESDATYSGVPSTSNDADNFTFIQVDTDRRGQPPVSKEDNYQQDSQDVTLQKLSEALASGIKSYDPSQADRDDQQRITSVFNLDHPLGQGSNQRDGHNSDPTTGATSASSPPDTLGPTSGVGKTTVPYCQADLNQHSQQGIAHLEDTGGEWEDWDRDPSRVGKPEDAVRGTPDREQPQREAGKSAQNHDLISGVDLTELEKEVKSSEVGLLPLPVRPATDGGSWPQEDLAEAQALFSSEVTTGLPSTMERERQDQEGRVKGVTPTPPGADQSHTGGISPPTGAGAESEGVGAGEGGVGGGGGGGGKGSGPSVVKKPTPEKSPAPTPASKDEPMEPEKPHPEKCLNIDITPGKTPLKTPNTKDKPSTETLTLPGLQLASETPIDNPSPADSGVGGLSTPTTMVSSTSSIESPGTPGPVTQHEEDPGLSGNVTSSGHAPVSVITTGRDLAERQGGSSDPPPTMSTGAPPGMQQPPSQAQTSPRPSQCQLNAKEDLRHHKENGGGEVLVCGSELSPTTKADVEDPSGGLLVADTPSSKEEEGREERVKAEQAPGGTQIGSIINTDTPKDQSGSSIEVTQNIGVNVNQNPGVVIMGNVEGGEQDPQGESVTQIGGEGIPPPPGAGAELPEGQAGSSTTTGAGLPIPSRHPLEVGSDNASIVSGDDSFEDAEESFLGPDGPGGVGSGSGQSQGSGQEGGVADTPTPQTDHPTTPTPPGNDVSEGATPETPPTSEHVSSGQVVHDKNMEANSPNSKDPIEDKTIKEDKASENSKIQDKPTDVNPEVNKENKSEETSGSKAIAIEDTEKSSVKQEQQTENKVSDSSVCTDDINSDNTKSKGTDITKGVESDKKQESGTLDPTTDQVNAAKPTEDQHNEDRIKSEKSNGEVQKPESDTAVKEGEKTGSDTLFLEDKGHKVDVKSDTDKETINVDINQTVKEEVKDETKAGDQMKAEEIKDESAQPLGMDDKIKEKDMKDAIPEGEPAKSETLNNESPVDDKDMKTAANKNDKENAEKTEDKSTEKTGDQIKDDQGKKKQVKECLLKPNAAAEGNHARSDKPKEELVGRDQVPPPHSQDGQPSQSEEGKPKTLTQVKGDKTTKPADHTPERSMDETPNAEASEAIKDIVKDVESKDKTVSMSDRKGSSGTDHAKNKDTYAIDSQKKDQSSVCNNEAIEKSVNEINSTPAAIVKLEKGDSEDKVGVPSDLSKGKLDNMVDPNRPGELKVSEEIIGGEIKGAATEPTTGAESATNSMGVNLKTTADPAPQTTSIVPSTSPIQGDTKSIEAEPEEIVESAASKARSGVSSPGVDVGPHTKITSENIGAPSTPAGPTPTDTTQAGSANVERPADADTSENKPSLGPSQPAGDVGLAGEHNNTGEVGPTLKVGGNYDVGVTEGKGSQESSMNEEGKGAIDQTSTGETAPATLEETQEERSGQCKTSSTGSAGETQAMGTKTIETTEHVEGSSGTTTTDQNQNRVDEKVQDPSCQTSPPEATEEVGEKPTVSGESQVSGAAVEIDSPGERQQKVPPPEGEGIDSTTPGDQKASESSTDSDNKDKDINMKVEAQGSPTPGLDKAPVGTTSLPDDPDVSAQEEPDNIPAKEGIVSAPLENDTDSSDKQVESTTDTSVKQVESTADMSVKQVVSTTTPVDTGDTPGKAEAPGVDNAPVSGTQGVDPSVKGEQPISTEGNNNKLDSSSPEKADDSLKSFVSSLTIPADAPEAGSGLEGAPLAPPPGGEEVSQPQEAEKSPGLEKGVDLPETAGGPGALPETGQQDTVAPSNADAMADVAGDVTTKKVRMTGNISIGW